MKSLNRLKRNQFKSSLLFVLSIVSLNPLGIRADEPQSNQPIATYDFESPAHIASWREEKKAGEPPAIMALDAENPYAGKFSFKFGTDHDALAALTTYTRVSLPKPATKGRVTVQFYGRTTPNLSCKAAFRVLEFSKGKPVGWIGNVTDMVVIDKGKDWSIYRAEAVLRDETDALYLYSFLAKPKTGEALWIDDLTVSLKR